MNLDKKKRKSKFEERMSLEKRNIFSLNIFLGFRTLILKFKTWVMLPFVFALALSIVVIPLNLLSTFSSSKFVTYMGSAVCDIRLDLQDKDVLDRKYEIDMGVKENGEVADVNSFATCNYKIKGEDGWENMRVECGDYSKFSVSYLRGTHPETANQIALSFLNAERFGVEVGDKVVLQMNSQEVQYEVCGIYQDITYGGFTAKIVYHYDPEDVEWYTYYINLKDHSNVDSVAENLENQFPYAKVTPISLLET